MNYIEFELGGKLRGFKFGIGCLGEILEHFDKDIAELGKLMVKNPFSITHKVLYFAHKFDCERKGIPVTFTLQEVSDWLDEIENALSDKNVAAAIKLFVDTIIKYLPKTPQVEDEEKKN